MPLLVIEFDQVTQRKPLSEAEKKHQDERYGGGGANSLFAIGNEVLGYERTMDRMNIRLFGKYLLCTVLKGKVTGCFDSSHWQPRYRRDPMEKRF